MWPLVKKGKYVIAVLKSKDNYEDISAVIKSKNNYEGIRKSLAELQE